MSPTVPSISALDKRMKIAIGSVSVRIAMLPATISVAPNSPKAFAQVRITAAIKPFRASGNVTLKKT